MTQWVKDLALSLQCLKLLLQCRFDSLAWELPHAMSVAKMKDYFILFYFILFYFLGLHLLHMEVPGLGVELELQLLAYATATATATPDPSHICNLHHSSWQCQIL